MVWQKLDRAAMPDERNAVSAHQVTHMPGGVRNIGSGYPQFASDQIECERLRHGYSSTVEGRADGRAVKCGHL